MNKLTIRGTVLVLMLWGSTTVARADDPDPANPIQLVDPFISTGGNRYVCGNNSPGANVPFGVVRLSPDTISAFGCDGDEYVGLLLSRLRPFWDSATRGCAAPGRSMGDIFA